MPLSVCPPRPARSLSAVAGRLVCQLLRLPSLHLPPLSMRQLLEHQQQHPPQPGADSAPAAATAAGAANPSSSISCCEPVLFVLTAGADPSQELAAFAEAQLAGSGGRLHELAMGQGQAEVALQLLRECARTGGCVGAGGAWMHP
jgi:hypothetical protein